MVNRKYVLSILAFFLVGWGVPLQAAVVSSLYEVSLPDSPSALSEALKTALSRLSGEASDSFTTEAYAQALSRPGAYIQHYSHVKQDDAPYLNVQFSPENLRTLLHRHELPVLGENRPRLLVWLAVEDSYSRRLIGTYSHEMPEQLQQAAQAAFVPIVLPLLDLEDVAALSVTEVWGTFLPVIEKASVRYGADATLVVRLQETSEQWVGQWTLLLPGGALHQEHDGHTLEEQLTVGFNHVASALAKQYGLVPNANMNERISLTVSHLDQVTDYVVVRDYLSQLPAVERLEVLQASQGKVTFSIIPHSSITSVFQALEIDHKLMPYQGSYRWQGSS